MMLRLNQLVTETFPGLKRHPTGLAILGMAMLTLYVKLSKKRMAPEWWWEVIPQWTGIEVQALIRYWWRDANCLIWLMVVPLILMRVLAGWRPRQLGFVLKGTGKEFLLVTGMWLAFLPVLWLISDMPSFAKTYPRVDEVASSGHLFAVHHLSFLVYWIAWEFFYRGLLLFGFKRDFGSSAVLLSTFPFVIMHYGKPPLEMMAAIAAGFILCGISLRSKSIFPGVFLHWMVALSMDFVRCSFWR